MTKETRGCVLNLFLVMVMALSPVLNKFSLATVTPLQVSFLNALFSALMTGGYMLIMREPLRLVRNKYLWLLGLTNALGIILQYASLSLLDPVSVGLLGRFYIVFALVLSVLILKEPFHQRELGPIVLVVLGTFLVTNFGGDFNSVIGAMMAIAYTFFFALTNLLAKRVVEGESARLILLYNQVISALILVGVLAVRGELGISLGSGVVSIVGSAFLSGFLGLLLFYEGLKYISFKEANLIRALNPVFVFIFSYPFFPVELTPKFLAGAMLIIGSIVYLNLQRE